MELKWHKHKAGDPNPIPWAKAGEFSFKVPWEVFHQAKANASALSWGGVTEFALLDGWILCDGKIMPEEIRDCLFEYKFRGGKAVVRSFNVGSSYLKAHWQHCGRGLEIIAVRPIVAKEEPAMRDAAERSKILDKTITAPRQLTDTENDVMWAALKRSAKIISPSRVRQMIFSEPMNPNSFEPDDDTGTVERETYEAYMRAAERHPELRLDRKEKRPACAIGEDAIEGAIFEALCKSFERP